MNEMQTNPDLDLVMNYLRSITPGDMSPEASEQLMMIGRRIQAGGTLSDQEREMFQSVVGAMPQSTQSANEMNAINDAKDMSSQVFQPPEPNVPSLQGNYNSTVQVDPMSQVRPQLRPAGMGVRPQLRPDNLGG
tara:strand:- start:23 stop:424 length:402 start_codon:yes stop_codon:yes gene_type:complete